MRRSATLAAPLLVGALTASAGCAGMLDRARQPIEAMVQDGLVLSDAVANLATASEARRQQVLDLNSRVASNLRLLDRFLRENP